MSWRVTCVCRLSDISSAATDKTKTCYIFIPKPLKLNCAAAKKKKKQLSVSHMISKQASVEFNSAHGPQRGQEEGKIRQNRCVVNSAEKQDAGKAIHKSNLLVNIAWKYGLQDASTTL